VLVLERDAEEIRRVETEAAAGFGVSEGGAGGGVEDEGGFEVGTGAGEVDPADALAEVEAFGEDGAALVVEGFGRREQAAETAAEVGGAGEVGLGCGV
jgi:hypothetical protein